jgi:hypothetical protein
VTQEAKLFARMSAFGLGIAVVYWFLTYEPAGTVLLLLFGVAAGIGAVAEIVASGRWRPGRGSLRPTPPTEQPGPVVRVPAAPLVEPIPRPGWAPIGVGFGLGALALGAAFGPAPAIAGVLLVLLSARAWLSAALRETDEARAEERPALDETRPSPPPA